MNNRIYFWYVLNYAKRLAIAVGISIIILDTTFYYLIRGTNILLHFSTAVMLAICGSIMAVFFTIMGGINKYGPRKLTITDVGLELLYSGKNTVFVPWEKIYGIIEIGETYTSTKYRKPSKQKEYRIYYYDNNKRLKWFCVSEEVYVKMKDKLNSVLKK